MSSVFLFQTKKIAPIENALSSGLFLAYSIHSYLTAATFGCIILSHMLHYSFDRFFAYKSVSAIVYEDGGGKNNGV